jgi:alkylhydroperoxidase family enzyme
MRDALAALQPPDARHPPLRHEGRPKGLNGLGTLAHHPALTRAFFSFYGHVLSASTLSPRQRELLCLRVAAVRASQYEWEQHVVLAGDAGIDSGEITRIRRGSEAPGWSPVEGAMLDAVDELLRDARVADVTWGTLAAELDEHQLMDLVFAVGAFDMLAMAFESFGVTLDEDLVAWKTEHS